MEIDEAIKRTIGYAKAYEGGLDKEELFVRLISSRAFPRKAVNKASRKWVLPQSNRKKNARAKLNIAKELAYRIGKNFDKVLFVGISGSVAAGYPKGEDDIDLVIITKKDTLWLCRLQIWIWAKRNKIEMRSYGGKEVKDAFCFNVWLEEDYLAVPKGKRNLRSAVDLILLTPLVDKGGLMRKLVKSNMWAKKYVATGIREIWKREKQRERIPGSSLIARAGNWGCYFLQRGYMARKITGEIVNRKQAWFHKNTRQGGKFQEME
jgi:hypothetical protein